MELVCAKALKLMPSRRFSHPSSRLLPSPHSASTFRRHSAWLSCRDFPGSARHRPASNGGRAFTSTQPHPTEGLLETPAELEGSSSHLLGHRRLWFPGSRGSPRHGTFTRLGAGRLHHPRGSGPPWDL